MPDPDRLPETAHLGQFADTLSAAAIQIVDEAYRRAASLLREPGIVVVHDRQVSYVSDGVCRLAGRPRRQLIGLPLTDLQFPGALELRAIPQDDGSLIAHVWPDSVWG